MRWGPALALLCVVGCNDLRVVDPAAPAVAKTGDSPQQKQKVAAGKLARKTLKIISTQPARIVAYEQTPLSARIPGYVGEVFVDIGTHVKRGDKLLKLLVPELEVELRQKEALVAQSAAEIKQAEASRRAAEAAVKTTKSKLEQARAGIGKAEPNVERYQLEYARVKKLADDGSVTQKLVDEVRSQLQIAEAAVQESRSSLAAVQAEVEQFESLVAKAEADESTAAAKLQVAEANRDYARTMLDYATLTAPFDGVVTRRDVDPGHAVTAGPNARPLLVIAETSHVRIQVDVPELDAAFADVGDPATLRVQALRDKEFAGKIARTSWSLDEGNRSLRVEIDLDAPAEELRPGLYAVAQLQLAEAKDALALPNGGVVRQGGETFACVVVDGRIERHAVQLGFRAGDEWQVLAGLSESDTTVLARADGLKPGQEVQVEEPKK